jgi:hypothetical protein
LRRPLLQASQLFKVLATVPQDQHTSAGHARECAALERIAQQNRLACMVAERALANGAQLELSFEFSQHRTFPVAVLKSKKL